MSWAEIKKAINSKLGTSEFKPLDMQVDDLANTVAARTKISIQTITFDAQRLTTTVNITPVDITKTLILPISQVANPNGYITSVGYSFQNISGNIASSVRCTITMSGQLTSPNVKPTIALITFGEQLEGGIE